MIGVIIGWTTGASGAPITVTTALPVAEGEFMVREQIIFNHGDSDPKTKARERTARTIVSVLAYGVNSDLAVFAVVPYVSKSLKAGASAIGRHADGLGDMKIFGRYTLFKNNFNGGSFRIAPVAGLKIPTGNSNRRDALGRLPISVQPGSGSWDPFGGVVITYQTLDFQIDAAISYTVNTGANSTANGFKFGDVSRLDGSFQYRLWPGKLGSGTPGFLYGVLEANLVHQQNNHVNGIEDAGSGGTRLFLVPGLQYVTRRWIAEAAIQLPVMQNLNGMALRDHYTARAGLRFNF
ncbi:MAG: transporter [Alphaproteobacteria bacterium]|nr:transporter [Alphaproteobacteria bacterium]